MDAFQSQKITKNIKKILELKLKQTFIQTLVKYI